MNTKLEAQMEKELVDEIMGQNEAGVVQSILPAFENRDAHRRPPHPHSPTKKDHIPGKDEPVAAALPDVGTKMAELAAHATSIVDVFEEFTRYLVGEMEGAEKLHRDKVNLRPDLPLIERLEHASDGVLFELGRLGRLIKHARTRVMSSK